MIAKYPFIGPSLLLYDVRSNLLISKRMSQDNMIQIKVLLSETHIGGHSSFC
jgi:hypothetical protein